MIPAQPANQFFHPGRPFYLLISEPTVTVSYTVDKLADDVHIFCTVQNN